MFRIIIALNTFYCSENKSCASSFPGSLLIITCLSSAITSFHLEYLSLWLGLLETLKWFKAYREFPSAMELFKKMPRALTIASSALWRFCLCHSLWQLILEGEWSFLIPFSVVVSNSPKMSQTLLTAWTVSFMSLSLTKPRNGHILDVQWMLVEYFIWLENNICHFCCHYVECCLLQGFLKLFKPACKLKHN